MPSIWTTTGYYLHTPECSKALPGSLRVAYDTLHKLYNHDIVVVAVNWATAQHCNRVILYAQIRWVNKVVWQRQSSGNNSFVVLRRLQHNRSSPWFEFRIPNQTLTAYVIAANSICHHHHQSIRRALWPFPPLASSPSPAIQVTWNIKSSRHHIIPIRNNSG